MEVEGAVWEADSEPVDDILCVSQRRGQADDPHVLLDGFIILIILLIAQHFTLNTPNSAHNDLISSSRASMTLVKQVDVVKNVETHLLDLLSLPPLPRDEIPLLRGANDDVAAGQSLQVTLDLSCKSVGQELDIEA